MRNRWQDADSDAGALRADDQKIGKSGQVIVVALSTDVTESFTHLAVTFSHRDINIPYDSNRGYGIRKLYCASAARVASAMRLRLIDDQRRRLAAGVGSGAGSAGWWGWLVWGVIWRA